MQCAEKWVTVTSRFFDGQIELDPVPFRSTTKLCIAQMELKINIDHMNIVSGSGEP